MSSKQIKRLVFSALMLALATGLSLIPLGIQMPMGGKLTLCSMLPICLVSIKYGTKWGLLVSFTYSLIQLFLSLTELMGWGMTVFGWVGALVFDYLVAYTVLGISATLFPAASSSASGAGRAGTRSCIPFATTVRICCPN